MVEYSRIEVARNSIFQKYPSFCRPDRYKCAGPCLVMTCYLHMRTCAICVECHAYKLPSERSTDLDVSKVLSTFLATRQNLLLIKYKKHLQAFGQSSVLSFIYLSSYNELSSPIFNKMWKHISNMIAWSRNVKKLIVFLLHFNIRAPQQLGRPREVAASGMWSAN